MFHVPPSRRTTLHALKSSTALFSSMLIATTGLTTNLWAQELPQGGSVAAGSATISQTAPNALTINQTSATAVTNWQSFSIGQGSSVSVVQPSTSSAMLARVTGGTTSTIAGSLSATGQFMLINPNGISITASGTVNAGGGFVATTLGMSDDDFLAGKRSFKGNGASGAVSNDGAISVGPGGYAALIGGTVSNSGTISVPMGKVGLGSGEIATLDFSGDGFLQVGVPTSASGTGALVSNAGKITANGGTVQIKAAQARDAARQAINMSGVIEARSVSGSNGNITLGGGDGAVAVSGKLDATSTTGKGGNITVTGRKIALAGATLDASGKTGGGKIRIGGDRQGTGTLARAESTSIDVASVIRADATDTGNGGDVVVWSDGKTSFAGLITARGGANGGNGGEAEVSGKAQLAYTGLTVLTAARGTTGTLLLDPYNVTISNDADTGGFDASANDSIINVTTLQTALANANVTISTGSSGSQTGDITVAAPLTWSANNLTLNAYHSINVNSTITVGGTGGLLLNTNVGGGTGGEISYGLTGSGFAGRIDFTGTPGAQALLINGAMYTLVYSLADLQNINNGLSGRYALAASLDLSGQTYTDALIGQNSSTAFTGTFDGLGHTISNLTINKSGDYAGLFGYTDGAAISNIGTVGGSVTGISNTGSLVGFAGNGTISNAYATGTVSSSGNYVGGLIGYSQYNEISNSYATGAVSGSNNTGGLVGRSSGDTINKSYATGLTSGYGNVGGLIGTTSIYSTITNSYATGAVSGSGYNVGGLVGYTDSGSIVQSYATGTVSGTYYVGGLVGRAQTTTTIDNAYATGTVSSSGDYVGGLVGYLADNGTISSSYATGAVSGYNYNFYIGGLVGYLTDAGTISSSYATGAVSGYDNVGGLVGYLTYSGTISSSYATGAVSGYNNVGGLVGLMTNGGTINNAYATGAVRGINYLGGLVGQTSSSTIDNAYATGAVSGNNYLGGLVGNAQQSTIGHVYATGAIISGSGYAVGGLVGNAQQSTISDAYWDTQTSGYSNAIGSDTNNQLTNVTGLTTAQFQDASAASALGNAFTFTANLYPYLTSFFPNGVKAISGVAYADSGVTVYASNASGARYVYVDIAGVRTAVTTGANGYYYVMVGADTLSTANGGTALLAYTRDGNTTGAVSGAYLTRTSTSVQHADIWAHTLIAPTTATSLSTSPTAAALLSANQTLLASAAGSDSVVTDATSGVAGLTLAGYIATSARGFNIDQGISAYGLYVRTTSGVINVSSAQTLGGPINLTLLSSDDLNISAAVQVNGNGALNLGYGGKLNVAMGSSGFTGSITFANADGTEATASAGGTLTVNDKAYTLLYTMADVANANNNLAGLYALARSIDASGQTYTDALIGQNSNTQNQFTGTFDGLGHTISNLTINKSNDYAGLFGFAFNATIRNIGMVGGSVTGYNYVGGLVGQLYTGSITNAYVTGAVKGSFYIGGLAGTTYQATITNAYTTGAVNSDGYYVGGLVGSADITTIINAHATGAVSGSYNVGGLVGQLQGSSIRNAYATGAASGAYMVGGLVGYSDASDITDAYATGAISGIDYVGGLVGQAYSGSISTAYATGTVQGNEKVGGLVGYIYGGIVISDTYATGAVSGSSTRIGGLVGYSYASSITRSYATGAVSGSSMYVGGLVGYAEDGSSVTQSYATGAVSGSSNYVGGLVGYANNGSSITQSYATGAVSGGDSVGGLIGYANSVTFSNAYATGMVSGSNNVGGLVGSSISTQIDRSYATGAVSSSNDYIGGLVGYASNGIITQSYATGAVSGGDSVGGLIGYADSVTFSNAYATGMVSGSNNVGGLVGYLNGGLIDNAYATGATRGAASVGGLVGYLNGGLISNAYATGAVSGTSNAGGLVGYSFSGNILSGFWDTQTTGRSNGIGDSYGGNIYVTGLTTAQFQDGSSAHFFGNALTVSANLYPYLTSFFPNGVKAISGIAYKDSGTTLLASGASGAGLVYVRSGTGAVQTVTTGANGYYYAIVANDGTTGNVLAYTTADGTTGAGNGTAFKTGVSSNASGMDIHAGWRRDDTGLATLTALDSAYATAVTGTTASGLSLANRRIFTSSSFSLDSALSVTGTLNIQSAFAITQTAALSADALVLQGYENAFTLRNSGNRFNSLSLSGADVDLDIVDGSSLTLSGIEANALRIVTAGDLTIAAATTVTGDAPVLAAGGAFINNAGANAVTANNGRWLIYAASSTGNTFGGLDSANTAVWGTAAGGTVTAAGNRYVFAEQATLTVTALDAEKSSGQTTGFNGYTVSGFKRGIAGAFLDDAPSGLTGSPGLSSAGAAAEAAPGTYAIAVSRGSLVWSGNGYAFNFVSGKLIVKSTSPPAGSFAPPPASFASGPTDGTFQVFAPGAPGGSPTGFDVSNPASFSSPGFESAIVCFPGRACE